MSCENTVTYFIPKGYDYKEIFGKCGSTGYDGNRLICYDCERDPRKMAEIERHFNGKPFSVAFCLYRRIPSSIRFA